LSSSIKNKLSSYLRNYKGYQGKVVSFER